MMEAIMQSPFLPKTTEQSQSDYWWLLRKKAEQTMKDQTWPDAFQKAWNYAELDSIKGMTPDAELNIKTKMDQAPIIETSGSTLVFINGNFDSSRSNTSNIPQGVQMLNIASNSYLAHKLGSLINSIDMNLLANLNTAKFTDGLVLVVPEDTQVKVPLRVSFINNQTCSSHATISLPRLFILLKKGSSATLLEDYQGCGRYLTSSVAEIIVGSNARLNHERIQQESLEALHFSQLAIRVEHNGCYNCRTVSLGGHISSSIQNINIIEKDADVTMDVLTILGGNQIGNAKSIIDHSSSSCTSRQTYRIIADNSSRAAFDSTICVHKDTHDTNAQQQCRGLLLDAEAQINVKPQLKIYTDDVKCNHEVAVGQLDSDMLFYLQSRGINASLANNMLTHAFASSTLNSISIPSLKQRLSKLVISLTNANYLKKLK